MKHFLYCLFTLFYSIYGYSQIISSDIITTSGDNYKNNYATMQITIGEPIIETKSNNEIAITQGFQQTEIIVTPTNTEEQQIANISVYPNPAEHLLKIDFKGNSYNYFVYELFDNTGKCLVKRKITTDITEIPLVHFVSGLYVLKISSLESKKTQNFLIEKR